jgi:hypothetical protein
VSKVEHRLRIPGNKIPNDVFGSKVKGEIGIGGKVKDKYNGERKGKRKNKDKKFIQNFSES